MSLTGDDDVGRGLGLLSRAGGFDEALEGAVVVLANLLHLHAAVALFQVLAVVGYAAFRGRAWVHVHASLAGYLDAAQVDGHRHLAQDGQVPPDSHRHVSLWLDVYVHVR